MNYTFSAIAVIKGVFFPLQYTIDFCDINFIRKRWEAIPYFERFEVEPHLIN